MRRFLLAPAVAQDLDNIWEFIAHDSLTHADRMIERLYTSFLKLAETPGMGHTRKDLAEDRPILFWPVGNYLVVYRNREQVEIIAVVNGNRDVPTFLQRRKL